MELVQVARGLTPALEGSGQQDVEEFLNALDGVHEHLKRPLSDREETDEGAARAAVAALHRPGVARRGEAGHTRRSQGGGREERRKEQAGRSRRRPEEGPVVDDVRFIPGALSAVTCCGCGQVSYTCDPFFSLSVPIPSRHFDMSEFEIQSAMDVEMENDSKGSNGNGNGGNGNGNPRRRRGSTAAASFLG